METVYSVTCCTVFIVVPLAVHLVRGETDCKIISSYLQWCKNVSQFEERNGGMGWVPLLHLYKDKARWTLLRQISADICLFCIGSNLYRRWMVCLTACVGALSTVTALQSSRWLPRANTTSNI